MYAALPMYDRPETAPALDALWARIRDGLRARGIEAPEALDRGVEHMEGWARPDLLLGQMCNLPWRARFRGRVTLIGAADFGLEGAAPGEYYSLMIGPTGPAQAPVARMAVNDPLSNSGWDAGQAWARANGVGIGSVLVTGSHAESLRAVAGGRADLAAIDAVTWRALERWEPSSAAVRVVGRTHASPGMTFVTAPGRDPAPFRAAIAEAIAAMRPAPEGLLGLKGIVPLPPEAYERPLPPSPPGLS